VNFLTLSQRPDASVTAMSRCWSSVMHYQQANVGLLTDLLRATRRDFPSIASGVITAGRRLLSRCRAKPSVNGTWKVKCSCLLSTMHGTPGLPARAASTDVQTMPWARGRAAAFYLAAHHPGRISTIVANSKASVYVR
jgi:hypothetical protein